MPINPLRRVWQEIIYRCTNPNNRLYPSYGGRGITICERWLNSFENFATDMGPRPPNYTVERVDNDGPYSPENCVWASRTQQAQNRRKPRFFHIKSIVNKPMRYIHKTTYGTYRVTISLRKNYVYARNLPTLEDALELRANLEMEREMYQRLGGV